jgi:hypothetical protein
MAQEVLGTDVNGKVDFTLPKPIACRDEVLTANIPASVTTPANFNRAYFSIAVGTNVWVTYDGSVPVVPAVSADSTQELNPAGRQININGGETLKFISDTASHVNIRWDKGQ